MAPTPKPGLCARKQSLWEAYLKAVREINTLQSAEAKALVEGDVELERIELALTAARENRDKAKLAYLLHVDQHGC